MDNSRALNNGFKKANQIISGHLESILVSVCGDLIGDALVKAAFEGFTGQTHTSYACGLYIDGALTNIVFSADRMPKPVHAKVRKGELVYLKRPYMGKARSVRGRVDVDDKTGMESSFDFLKGYKPSHTNGFAIVMTTGTEYSEYIESARKLNVLNNTYKNAKNIFMSNIKPIK